MKRYLRIGRFITALALAAALAATSVAFAQSDSVSIQVLAPGAPATPAAYGSLANPITGLSTIATYAPDQWAGAAQVTETASYGRAAAALYAQSTGLGTGTISIELSNVPTADVVLTLVGLDDDAPTKTPIEVTINQKSIYTGDSWFADWGGKPGEGNWTSVQITIPKGMFGGGVNAITVSNTSATGNEGEVPYIILGGATVEITGVEVAPIALS